MKTYLLILALVGCGAETKDPGTQALDTATSQGGSQGEKGDKGDKGDAGAQGPAGPKGDKGDTGSAGASGANGSAGVQGIQGVTGAAGAVSVFTAAGTKIGYYLGNVGSSSTDEDQSTIVTLDGGIFFTDLQIGDWEGSQGPYQGGDNKSASVSCFFTSSDCSGSCIVGTTTAMFNPSGSRANGFEMVTGSTAWDGTHMFRVTGNEMDQGAVTVNSEIFLSAGATSAWQCQTVNYAYIHSFTLTTQEQLTMPLGPLHVGVQ